MTISSLKSASPLGPARRSQPQNTPTDPQDTLSPAEQHGPEQRSPWRTALMIGGPALSLLGLAGCGQANVQVQNQTEQQFHWLQQANGQKIDVTVGANSGAGVAMSADGQHWIAAGSKGVMIDGQWVKDGNKNLDVTVGADSGAGVAMTPDGKHWMAAGSKGVVIDGHWVKGLDVTVGGNAGAGVAMSDDGQHWIAAGSKGVVLDGKWIAHNQRPLDVTVGSEAGAGVAITPDGQTWMAAGSAGIVRSNR